MLFSIMHSLSAFSAMRRARDRKLWFACNVMRSKYDVLQPAKLFSSELGNSGNRFSGERNGNGCYICSKLSWMIIVSVQ